MLSPATRAASIAALDAAIFDTVIIGGGITGVGAALDAASRGLRVALFERDDLASGTSSKSSKLIHGGLRYLEHLDFRLVFEALHERTALLTDIAPGIVEPVRFVIPITAPIWQRAYLGAGVALYDLLASARGGSPLPRHRHLGRVRLRQLMPGIRPDTARGGIVFWDAQMDDARYTMLVARTAALHGASVCTRCEVVDLLRDDTRVCGVEILDRETGDTHTVRSRSVINATGVWTDDIEQLVDDSSLQVRAAKGIHLVVARDRIDASAGMLLRTEKSVLFVIPWHDRWLVGTTDTPWTLDRDRPVATSSDIDYVLEQVNTVLARPLCRDDILGVFAGLRPLVDTRSERHHRAARRRDDTTKISREHVVRHVAPGLVTIAGGKFTTYRLMAADAVDAAVGDFCNVASRTITLALVGSDKSTDTRDELQQLIDDHPALDRPLTHAPTTSAADVVHAVIHEGALHLDDVLERRTRLSMTTADRGALAAGEVASLIGPHLGWNTAQTEREVAVYCAALDRARAGELAPDDATAVALVQDPRAAVSFT